MWLYTAPDKKFSSQSFWFYLGRWEWAIYYLNGLSFKLFDVSFKVDIFWAAEQL